MWICRHRRVGVHLDQQIQKSLGSCGSADTEEFGFMWISRHRRAGIYVDQQAWMSRSHGHLLTRMSLNLCRSAGMDEFVLM
jgi:hypothetical protein